MDIQNSTPDDLPMIFEMYEMAIAHQKKVSHLHWQAFDREMVSQEISEGRQWKIMVDGQAACVFVSTFSDPHIWGEKDREPSIYLHRIVTRPDFRGRNFVQEIVNWAKIYGKKNGRKFIRMDTWGDNPKLIEYYQKCGFRFLGVALPSNREMLPAHYSCITLAFFEMEID